MSLARKLRLAGLFILAVLLLATLLSRPPVPPPDTSLMLLEAGNALARGDHAEADRSLERLFEQPQIPNQAYLLAGEAALQRGDQNKALAFYRDMPQDGSEASLKALLAMAEIHFGRQELARAAQCYRQAAAESPQLLLAHQRLALIDNLEGRRLESVPHLMALVRGRSFDVKDLCMLANMQAVSFVDEDEEVLGRLRQQPGYLVGLARTALEADDLSTAQELLTLAVQQAPDLLEVRVWLGRIHVLKDDADAFAKWNRSLPASAERHPEVWLSRGLWEIRRRRMESALRCLWEGLRIDPNFLTLVDPFVETLIRTGRTETARLLSGWKADLTELAILSQRAYDNPAAFDAQAALQASAILERMGRYWEACAWCQVALEMDPQLSEADARLQRLAPRLVPPLPRNDPQRNPIAALDFSSLPLPPQSGRPDLAAPATSDALADSAGRPSWSRPDAIHFVDEAASRGLRAEFYFSEDRSTPGGRMFEFTGGGTAACDFDRDTLVDFYFTQGTQWPPDPENFEYLDSLYRQRPGGRFVDVAGSAGVVENSFSQGVAVGDLNQDGFQDIYVANIGGNRLFLNNGDGTFSEIARQAGVNSARWTTSVLMGDLNGDGLPELFDVNYLRSDDDDVYERICEVGGEPGACLPTLFSPEQDELWLNRGTGEFQNVTAQSGLDHYQGNGMGVLLLRLPDAPQPRLFVANDMTANQFYTAILPDAPGDVPRLIESGTLSGLAYSERGKAQACMGVALADADHDGQFDLFVTNFEKEYNTLYRTYSEGFFRDDSASFELTGVSLPFVGFGTAFLDLDLDTFPDLMLLNGHIDEFKRVFSPYRQPPQVLYNDHGRTFRELPAGQLGEFFQPTCRGRSLASTDWNRDGRIDVATSQLGAPVALVTNRTVTDSHYVTLRFVATRGDREALTTMCRLETSVGFQIGQLTGGDGYQCSNERMLHFGLGPATQIERLEVGWPDGEVTVYQNLAADREWLLVQDRPKPLAWPTPWPRRIVRPHPASDSDWGGTFDAGDARTFRTVSFPTLKGSEPKSSSVPSGNGCRSKRFHSTFSARPCSRRIAECRNRRATPVEHHRQSRDTPVRQHPASRRWTASLADPFEDFAEHAGLLLHVLIEDGQMADPGVAERQDDVLGRPMSGLSRHASEQNQHDERRAVIGDVLQPVHGKVLPGGR